MLTQAELREMLHYDAETGVFTWKHRPRGSFGSQRAYRVWNTRFAGIAAGAAHNAGYIKIRLRHESYLAHRLAWLYVHGEMPTNDIDHINGIRSDNRLTNLRNVTRAENLKNMGMTARNKSGVVGVVEATTPGKWKAQIRAGGTTKYLGTFDTIEAAAFARKSAEKAFGFHPNHGQTVPRYEEARA